MEQAVKHCTQGAGIWQWASNDQYSEPDIVMACCGDTPTLETLAAVSILRHYLTETIRGYLEEGTITTPFDMRVQNELDRFHLVQKAVELLPQLGNRGAYLIQMMKDKLVEHNQYISDYGLDLPEIRDWTWAESMKDL